jgi:hypothetical protein
MVVASMVATGNQFTRWAAISLLAGGILGMAVCTAISVLALGAEARNNAKLAKVVGESKVANKGSKQSDNATSPTAPPHQVKIKNGVPPVVSTVKNIGIYVANSPDDPAAVGVLQWAHNSGFNVVYNYSMIDGSEAQITSYLDNAQRLGIKVIISLKDLYDQLPDGSTTAAAHAQFGSNNEQIAQTVAAKFGNHPAVWGYGITDEAPMDASELAKWRPILTRRYQVIKATSNKPILATLVGKTSPNPTDRRSFLSALRTGSDHFALDYYPVPFEPIEGIQGIASDLPAVGDSDGWFVAQSFSWSRYPDTARAIGYNPSASRAPSTAEMVAMARLALAGGAKNIMFYSYFDIAGDPAQQAALSAAVRQLR